MHPWPKWSWTLCRFGWGLHKPIRHFDIPVSKLFRWVYDLFYAKNLIHWLILCTFLISASRRSCFGTALKYKFQVLVVSFLDARIGTISGVYQEAREPWECDSNCWKVQHKRLNCSKLWSPQFMNEYQLWASSINISYSLNSSSNPFE